MKYIVILIAAMAVLTVSCGRKKSEANSEEPALAQALADSAAMMAGVSGDTTAVATNDTTATVAPKPVEEPVFEMVTTYGTMRIKLFKDTPRHRDNFVKLVGEGFYDGLLFHRVIDGFMIQGGDPLTRDEANKSRFGTGDVGYTIPAEFVPEHKHVKGALAAARMGDAANPYKESSGCQFYIVQDDQGCRHLDGEYTVYGQVISGLDVIDKIAAARTDWYDCPERPVRILSVKPVNE